MVATVGTDKTGQLFHELVLAKQLDFNGKVAASAVPELGRNGCACFSTVSLQQEEKRRVSRHRFCEIRYGVLVDLLLWLNFSDVRGSSKGCFFLDVDVRISHGPLKKWQRKRDGNRKAAKQKQKEKKIREKKRKEKLKSCLGRLNPTCTGPAHKTKGPGRRQLEVGEGSGLSVQTVDG